jgi:hypothetical protein
LTRKRAAYLLLAVFGISYAAFLTLFFSVSTSAWVPTTVAIGSLALGWAIVLLVSGRLGRWFFWYMVVASPLVVLIASVLTSALIRQEPKS